MRKMMEICYYEVATHPSISICITEKLILPSAHMNQFLTFHFSLLSVLYYVQKLEIENNLRLWT